MMLAQTIFAPSVLEDPPACRSERLRTVQVYLPAIRFRRHRIAVPAAVGG